MTVSHRCGTWTPATSNFGSENDAQLREPAPEPRPTRRLEFTCREPGPIEPRLGRLKPRAPHRGPQSRKPAASSRPRDSLCGHLATKGSQGFAALRTFALVVFTARKADHGGGGNRCIYFPLDGQRLQAERRDPRLTLCQGHRKQLGTTRLHSSSTSIPRRTEIRIAQHPRLLEIPP